VNRRLGAPDSTLEMADSPMPGSMARLGQPIQPYDNHGHAVGMYACMYANGRHVSCPSARCGRRAPSVVPATHTPVQVD